MATEAHGEGWFSLTRENFAPYFLKESDSEDSAIEWVGTLHAIKDRLMSITAGSNGQSKADSSSKSEYMSPRPSTTERATRSPSMSVNHDQRLDPSGE